MLSRGGWVNAENDHPADVRQRVSSGRASGSDV